MDHNRPRGSGSTRQYARKSTTRGSLSPRSRMHQRRSAAVMRGLDQQQLQQQQQMLLEPDIQDINSSAINLEWQLVSTADREFGLNRRSPTRVLLEDSGASVESRLQYRPTALPRNQNRTTQSNSDNPDAAVSNNSASNSTNNANNS